VNSIWKVYPYPKVKNLYINHKIISLINNNLLPQSSASKLFLLRNVFRLSKKFSSLYKNMFRTNVVTSEFNISVKKFKASKVNVYLLIKLTTNTKHSKLSVHPSFSSYYYYTSNNNCILNIKKITNVWMNIIIFLTNLFYFNLQCLAFGNSYFKYEILALNWKVSSLISDIWRFTNAFIFFVSNKTTLKTEFYFKQLLSKGCRCVFIVDLYYHKSTLYYLNKLKFITIGPVPLVNNLYTLYLAMPVASNSVFSNLLFLRLILKLKKLNTKLTLENYKNVDQTIDN